MFFYSFSGFLLSGWLPGDPGPFPNERSLISHILCGPKILTGPDLTHFYLTQSLESHLCKRPTIYDRKMMDCLVRNHHGTNGKQYLHPFWSQNRLVPCLLIDSHLSHGALPVLKSGTRTKGRPPYLGRMARSWVHLGPLGMQGRRSGPLGNPL